jgi:hypothetical protein
MIPYLTADEITAYTVTPGLTMTDVATASATIDSYVGRSFGSMQHIEQARLTKKNGAYGKVAKGKLRHFPRISVTALSAKVPSPFGGLVETTYDPGCLWFDDEEFEYFTFVPPAFGNLGITTVNPALFASPTPTALTVTYTSGYTVIPEEIKIACGQVMDNIAINGGTVPWVSRDDYDMKIVLSDKEDSVMTNGIIKLIGLVRLF